jgi:asparagine synthase (glutamine-hydrolysing)
MQSRCKQARFSTDFSVKMREIVLKAVELLEASVRECCHGSNVGLVFSAGIDSTLIGFLASRFCRVEAFSVGVSGSHDLDYARKMVKPPFRINLVELGVKDIEAELPRIVKAAGSANPLDVSVAIPFYFASKKCSASGLKEMLCGQGGDELFGGYNRYIELLAKGTYEQLDDLMRKDLKNLPESNLNRDKAVCKANGVRLEIPFLGRGFVEFVQGIPIQLKVRELAEFEKPEYECVDNVGGLRLIRKYILRKMAEEVGLPDVVIQREKKAAQYGSGSQKSLEQLAKKNGFKKKASDAGRNDYTRMYLESLV